MKCLKGYALLIGLAIVASLEARVLSVGYGGQYVEIQLAINDAADGDTISVANGVYEEQINFLGKSILVAAREPDTNDWRAIENPDPTLTIIKLPQDASGNNLTVVTIPNSRDAELRGFTIRDGKGTLEEQPSDYRVYGGGIYVMNAQQVTLRKLIVRSNTTDANAPLQKGYGGGIALRSTPRVEIEECLIDSNSALGLGSIPQGFGGGIYIEDAGLVMSNSILTNNSVSAA